MRALSESIDAESLERPLKALALASRIELLALLREPRVLDEIDLLPSAAHPTGNPERHLTRQAVRNHLEKLIEVGLVRMRLGERRGDKGRKGVQEYVVDHARLFALVEELRKLTLIKPTIEADPFATIVLRPTDELAWPEGPKIVIVRGTHEGQALPLRHAMLQGGRGWVLGRSPRCSVRLEYDPYVSTENSEILRDGNGWKLLDLRTSRNGTWINWRRLPVGGETPLRSGDIIGIGRSLLLFRES